MAGNKLMTITLKSTIRLIYYTMVKYIVDHKYIR